LIEILQQSTQNCLAIHFSGKLTGPEYQQFIDALVERLKTGSQVSLVMNLVDFDFYGDFAAAKADLKFAFGEYNHIHRAAFVGDQKWLDWFTRFIDPFTRAEEKHFPADQLEAALDWACA
jgi:SpoIIAA-like